MAKSSRSLRRRSRAASSAPGSSRPAGPPARALRCFSALGSELEALDLAGRGLRQVGAELDPSRVLVRSELALHMLLKSFRQRIGARLAGFQHDIGLGLHQLVL